MFQCALRSKRLAVKTLPSWLLELSIAMRFGSCCCDVCDDSGTARGGQWVCTVLRPDQGHFEPTFTCTYIDLSFLSTSTSPSWAKTLTAQPLLYLPGSRDLTLRTASVAYLSTRPISSRERWASRLLVLSVHRAFLFIDINGPPQSRH